MTPFQKTEADILIIGGGISGLALACFLKQARPDCAVTILEGADRAGGAIRSHREDGFVAEWGAHGFLDNAAASMRLLTMAGLDTKAIKAELGRFVRYICLDGRLQTIPQSPAKILKSDLLSFGAKLRVLGDLWRKPLPGTPTVTNWVRHRFGSALLPFADAVFTGTYAGDIDRLLIDACFPMMRKLEKEHGSLLRGLFRRMRDKKNQDTGSEKKLPAMVSFPNGMEELPAFLAKQLDIRLQCPVVSLCRTGDTWQVRTAADTFSAAKVVTALEINKSLALLSTISGVPEPPPPVPVAHICTIALGMAQDVAVPFGFGFLAPAQEKRFCLGALFSSHMFPGRAPAGYQLIEALVGGRRHPERLEMDDADMVRAAWHDLKKLLPLPEEPAFARVLRTRSGIPQHETEYLAAKEYRDRVTKQLPGLHALGFGWEGIGINDMITAAEKTCQQICGGDTAEEKKMKGVYF